jgi:hypothetical protein
MRKAKSQSMLTCHEMTDRAAAFPLARLAQLVTTWGRTRMLKGTLAAPTSLLVVEAHAEPWGEGNNMCV